MPRFPRRARFLVAASVLISLGVVSLVIVLAARRAPAGPPIVLSYRECPVFLGPHEHSVAAIAFSPDGETLATGAHDGYLRIWDVATGKLRSIHSDDATRGIQGLAFSPDGSLVAVVGGSFGKEVTLWDIASGRIAHEFEEPAGSAGTAKSAPEDAPFIYKGRPTDYRVLTAVAFSPDGRTLATAPDGVVLRDVQSGGVIATLAQPSQGVKALAFSNDGKTLLTAAEDKQVRLWSVPVGELQATLDGPTQPLVAVALSHDGSRIVATSTGSRSLFDQTPVSSLWSWELPSGTARRIELGNVAAQQVAFVAPETVVVAAGRELLSIDLHEGEAARPRAIASHSEDVLAVAVSHDRQLVASGGADRTVDIREVATQKLVHRLPGLADRFSSVAASDDGRRFATATIDYRLTTRIPSDETSFAARHETYFSGAANVGRLQPSEVRIWSLDDARLESLLPLPPSQVTAVEFVPHSDLLAVAGWAPKKGGMLSLWDLNGAKHVHDFATQTAEVLSIAVSPDGQTLASGDAEGNLDLWDVASTSKTRSHKHEHAVEAVAFSADGKLLATADANRTAQVFDASSGKLVETLHSRSSIKSLEFSHDAKLLAAGTRHPGLELWDWRAGTASRTLKAAGDYVETMPGFVAFSPDGQFVACGGHGKDIAVFDVATGSLHGELSGHAHPATAAVFLRDGRLLSGGEERTVKLWDVNRRECLATWVAMPADEKQNWDDEWVAFKPTGEFVGSTPLYRLVGWQSRGDYLAPLEADRRWNVESLFPADAADSPSRE